MMAQNDAASDAEVGKQALDVCSCTPSGFKSCISTDIKSDSQYAVTQQAYTHEITNNKKVV